MSSGNVCFRCFRSGHFAKDCRGSGSVASANFKRCGKGGSAGCRSDRGVDCYKCKKYGHIARDCPEIDKCYRCEGVGHLARDCVQSASELQCYNCHKNGHLARDCKDERSIHAGPIGGSTSTCYNCNKLGHFARDCKERRYGVKDVAQKSD